MAVNFRLALILLPLTLLIQPSHANIKFIMKVCNLTLRYDFCVATLKSDRRSYNVSTPTAITGISLDITINDASGTFSYINDLADKNSGTPLEEPLNLCIQLYSNAIEDLKDGQEQFNSQSYTEAASTVSGTEDATDSCEGAFGDHSIGSPMSQRNQFAKDLIGLSGELLDLLASLRRHY